MGQIMQRLLEGVQAELQAEERDLCAHLNAQAHLLILEAHLDCLEGSGSGFEGPDAAGFDGTGSGKGKQAASAADSPDEPAMSDSTVRGKRRLSAGDILALKHLHHNAEMRFYCPQMLVILDFQCRDDEFAKQTIQD